MNDFFNSLSNSIYNALSNLDMHLHDTNLRNSAIDNFIHELRDYLVKSDVKYRLSKLPKWTLLDINEIEENAIQCYLNHEEYTVPKSIVYPNDLKKLENDGHIKMQLQDDVLCHVVRTHKRESN